MSTMDLTKEKIEQWATNTHDAHKILELDLESGEQFFMILRCKLGKKKPDKFIKGWVQKFSEFTLTNWIVNSTYPSIQRMLFRKTYICHHSNHNKAVKSDRTRSNQKNKDCKAKIDFRVKKITRNTCKNDPLLNEGLNCVIKLNFRHTHSVRSLESISLLRCSPKTKRKFIESFAMGMLPLVAKAYNEIQIRATYYDEQEREIQLANGMINPKLRFIERFYYSWRNENRDFVFDSFPKLVEEKKTIESNGAYLMIIENPKIIVVLTELTRKVFLKFGEEIFIDSSGCEGKDMNYKTSIFVPTKIGALPIGYVLHNGKTEEEYNQGFKTFTLALKEFCGKDLNPKIVMTSDGEQLEELGRIFPKSSIELCAYTNYTEFWTLLWCESTKVQLDDRKRLMTQYFNILTCQSKSNCEDLLQVMKNDASVISNKDLSEILDRLWSRREDWLPNAPESVTVRNTKALTSTHMRIYNNVVSENFRKFNSYTLVKLLTGPMNDIYKMYLMQYALKGVASTPIFTIFYDTGDFNILPLAPKEFMVQSLKDLDHVHTVYTDIVYCTCKPGTDGVYCKHLCAVEKAFPFHQTPVIDKLDREFYNCPEMSPGIRAAIQKPKESDDCLDEEDPNETASVKDQVSHDESDVNDNFDETDMNNDDFDFIVNDEIPEVKMEVPIEIIDRSRMQENHENEPSGLREEVCRITQMLENSRNKSKPLKRAINALKQAVNSDNEPEAESSSITSAHSTSKVRRAEASSSHDEEAAVVSKGWGLIYKRLIPKQKIYAKKAIDDILFEASLGTLGRNSVTITQNAMEVIEMDPFQIKDEIDDDYNLD